MRCALERTLTETRRRVNAPSGQLKQAPRGASLPSPSGEQPLNLRPHLRHGDLRVVHDKLI